MSLLATLKAARVRRPFGQFGQAADTSTWGGATGCGQTTCQSIIYAFKHAMPTHDQLSRLMGYWRPANRVGTSAEQLAKALGHWRLSYRAAYGQSLTQLRAVARSKGPVAIVVHYPEYPNWSRYHGVTRPHPWAAPENRAGANQFPKPGILHWILLAGEETGALVTVEPNHDSPARPENVAYDRVSVAALELAYNRGGRIAVVPTRSVA